MINPDDCPGAAGPAEGMTVDPVESQGMRLLGRHDLAGHGNGGEGTADSRPAHPLDDQFPVIVDLSEPGRPAEAGRWWLPGTQEGDDDPPPARHEVFDSAQDGSAVGAIQINDVYVTADGIVYAVDRSGGGLYILQFEGA